MDYGEPVEEALPSSLFSFRSLLFTGQVAQETGEDLLRFEVRRDAGGAVVPIDFFRPLPSSKGKLRLIRVVELLLNIVPMMEGPPVTREKIEEVASALGPLFTPYPWQVPYNQAIVESVRQWQALAHSLDAMLRMLERRKSATTNPLTESERREIARRQVVGDVGQTVFNSFSREQRERYILANMPSGESERDALQDGISRLADVLFQGGAGRRVRPVIEDDSALMYLDIPTGEQAIAVLLLLRMDLFAGRTIQRCARTGCPNVRLMRPDVKQEYCSEDCRSVRRQKRYRDKKKQQNSENIN